MHQTVKNVANGIKIIVTWRLVCTLIASSQGHIRDENNVN